MKRSSESGFSGPSPNSFTLVEVDLALGVVSFSLVAILSLLSVGLVGKKASDEEAAGALVLGKIGNSIREATNAEGNYVALGMCTNLVWTLGGSLVSLDYTNLSIGGIPDPEPTDQRLVAHVRLSPPASTASPGSAEVSVAWPRQAKWSDTTLNWTNAQGSISTYLIFLPQE